MHVDSSLKEANQPLPQHRGHHTVSDNEYKIRRHLTYIKQRISNEFDKWPGEIYDEEVKKMQTELSISKLAIYGM